MAIVRRRILNVTAQRLLALRHSPILFQLPPYLSALCIVIGIAWVLILPLDEYSRRTYVSENAILPGQVHTHFGGSEHDVFRAYRQEVYALNEKPEYERVTELKQLLHGIGLTPAEQAYEYNVAGEKIAGINTYALLQGPRADATEAMVLLAAWKNFDGEINYTGVALVLALARYFSRWSIWSKDIIVLIPADSTYGPLAWVDAYHAASIAPTSTRNISSLAIKAGALQAAVALDYPVGPWGQRFDKLNIMYDGINGALPNLDLLNTAVQIARDHNGVGCFLHAETQGDSYGDRLKTILAGVVAQGMGHATGPHSAFMPYHVDAITLKVSGDGWHDEITLGRVTESLFRSINNLLEHLHQSFFFYVLLSPDRFVSIGNYLPAAMLLAANFTVTALFLWVASGRKSIKATGPMQVVEMGKDKALVPVAALETAERPILRPIVTVLLAHIAGGTVFVAMNSQTLTPLATQWTSWLFLTSLQFLPVLAVPAFGAVVRALGTTEQHLQLVQSFSLLLLGAILSMMATLNFSLALVLGVAASPLSFIRPWSRSWLGSSVLRWALVPVVSLSLLLASPPAALVAAGIVRGYSWNTAASRVLGELVKGWSGQGAITSLVLWCVWFPSWLLGWAVLHSGLYT